LENDCFARLESGTPAEQQAAHNSIALYLSYQTTQDRTFSRYATELRKRRNERARAERGFVSQKHKEAADLRRQEMHQARQALQNAKQEGQQIRNRLAAAKAEALELKNLANKTHIAAQTPERALPAAA
jgi:glycine/D-amino acid oxidase-like deaminating enzyme